MIQRAPFTNKITGSALTCKTRVKSGMHKGAKKASHGVSRIKVLQTVSATESLM